VRRTLVVLALVAAFLATGVLVYLRVFRPQDDRPTWIVASYTGAVQAQVSGGAWKDVELKLELRDADRVRTGADGECTLLRDDSQVTVRSDTELMVSLLAAEASRFQMSAGQIAVEARGDGISIRTGAGARVDAKEASLGMTVRDDGWTQVKVKRGSADLSSNDQVEHVNEGKEAHAAAGAPPSKPVPIPVSILSNVRFPDADTFNSRLARVEGRADPGARVRVGGRSVDVGPDGAWATDIQLEEGMNQIEVEATDSLGTDQVERSHPIRVDVTAPGLAGATFGSRAAQGGVRP
jgi:hypothetical protein